MRFLRAHFYFNLKIIYNQIPYFDESVSDPSALASISNKEYTSDQLWEKILNDFKAAYEGLPGFPAGCGTSMQDDGPGLYG